MYYTTIIIKRKQCFLQVNHRHIFFFLKNMAEHVQDDGFYILNVLLVVNYSFVKLTLIMKTISTLR